MKAASQLDPIGGAGLLHALGAYGLWGVFPIFWKQLGAVPPGELLANRIVWSSVCVCSLLFALRRQREIRAVFADPKKRIALLTSTALISVNWFLFIWAVATDRILEASLGYYINPLVNVLLGRLVLGERLTRPAMLAVALACAGVLVLAIGLGVMPWVSLTLASTFALYGLRRKTVKVEPIIGLAVETLIVTPIALAFLALLAVRGELVAPRVSAWEIALLVSSGFVTAVPLVWFAEGARRLSLSTLGIMQYIAPTLQFVCAVVLYGEVLTRAHVVAFACIWTAVALYTGDGVRRHVRAQAT